MMCDVSVSGTSKRCLDGRPGHGPRSGVLLIIIRRPLTRKIGVLRRELPVCRGLSGSHGASFACYLFLQIFWIMRYPTDSVHVVAWPAVAADCDTTTSWVAPLGRPGSCLGLPILGCFCGSFLSCLCAQSFTRAWPWDIGHRGLHWVRPVLKSTISREGAGWALCKLPGWQ